MARPRARTLLFGLALLASACGPPTVSHDNRRLVESILTAVSAKNDDWLSQNERLIEARKAEGKMDAAEYDAFRAIIDAARAGRWTEAESQAFDLRDAQRPDRDDRAKLPEHARS